MGLSYVSWLFYFHAIALFLFSLSVSPTTAIATTLAGNERDRIALLAFKNQITHDPFGVMNLWNNSLHFCGWHGITCGRRHQRVTSLDLYSYKLAGVISPYIGNLTFLRVIDLGANNFNGQIPREIGRLFRLEILRLDNNSLGGEIPTVLSNCTNMKVINFNRNKFAGEIPVEFGSFSKLINFLSSLSNLTGGIPHSFGNLSSLEVLSLALNNLEGSIPDSLSRLTSLTYLALGGNKLSGKVPSSMYNLSFISTFSLPYNQLHGSLPPNLGFTLPNLELLNVGVNRFSGPIPVSIANASKLSNLTIAGNSFTGKLSINWGSLKGLSWLNMGDNNLGNGEANDLSFLTSLTNCSNLKYLDLENNNFGGVLPNSIVNLSSQLESFYLGGNKIFGSIPTGIGSLVSLTTLAMEFNLLTGSIPTTIGKLHNLQILYFSENRLSGKIPFSMGNLTQLIELELDGNYLSGSITPSLGNCKRLLLLHLSQNYFSGSISPSLKNCISLLKLDLSQNNFSGNIPKEVLTLSSLIEFNMSHNNLIGSLPLEVANLNNLERLDISKNKLSGDIPNSLGQCRSLIYLSIEGNFFQGTIPSALTTLSAIEHLDLSRNNLSGQIPKYLCNFTFLQYLNLSFNDFEGETPMEGVFKNATAISIVGNNKLCGGITELQLPVCLIKEPKKRGMSLAIKLIIVGCGVVLCLVFVSVLILYRRRTRKKKHPSTSSTRDQLLKISYQELLKATDGFSAANLIGAGSFGSVFKGIIGQGNSVVAVKVLNLQHRRASKSFMAECEALRNIRHRNLVKIITSCSSVDFHNNDFKALVYEFMPNGSLEGWLHSEAHAQVEIRNLTFLQRLNIAIDVANAMDYLHHHCQIPIIHCDLKPSNVLLDNDMTAHVSDFGLARFLENDADKPSQNLTSSIGIKGSIGYAAPEYGMGSEASTQGDVYSYGILLLEIFTGKRPTNDMFKDGINLHDFAKKALSERVMGIIDPTIIFIEEEEEEEGRGINNIQNNWQNLRRDKIEECLISVVRIGVACSMESPRERMNMNNVERELHFIRDFFLGVGIHGGLQQQI